MAFTALKQGVKKRLPPLASVRLYGFQNRNDLLGFGGPARGLSELVPDGSVAIDAGANCGLYTYWIARRASHVHAFEPISTLASYVRAARLPRVTVHNAALSDRNGSATLWVPETEGEASLSETVGGTPLKVDLMTLDSFGFTNVGFIKIDVEGHEMALIEGAESTIRTQKPTLFVEIEQRHHPERPVQEIIDAILGFGYEDSQFLLGGDWQPISRFDAGVHQKTEQGGLESDRYVGNFLFR